MGKNTPTIPHLRNFYQNITKKRPLLYKHQFIIQFIGGGNIDGKQLVELSPSLKQLFTNQGRFTYYAQSGDIPTATLNKATTNYFAGRFTVPTVRTWDHNWSTQILMDENLTIYHVLRDWQQLMSSYRNNGGGYRILPDVNLRVSILDGTHQYITTSYVLAGVWPKDIGEIQLQYANEASINPLQVSFSYQYAYQDSDLNAAANDPLRV